MGNKRGLMTVEYEERGKALDDRIYYPERLEGYEPSKEINLLPLPKLKSKWRHHNGIVYKVLHVANIDSTDLVKHPMQVVYKGKNGKIWTKTLSDFLVKMTEIPRKNKNR